MEMSEPIRWAAFDRILAFPAISPGFAPPGQAAIPKAIPGLKDRLKYSGRCYGRQNRPQGRHDLVKEDPKPKTSSREEGRLIHLLMVGLHRNLVHFEDAFTCLT